MEATDERRQTATESQKVVRETPRLFMCGYTSSSTPYPLHKNYL